jgi:hypothetical protein
MMSILLPALTVVMARYHHHTTCADTVRESMYTDSCLYKSVQYGLCEYVPHLP